MYIYIFSFIVYIFIISLVCSYCFYQIYLFLLLLALAALRPPKMKSNFPTLAYSSYVCVFVCMSVGVYVSVSDIYIGYLFLLLICRCQLLKIECTPRRLYRAPPNLSSFSFCSSLLFQHLISKFSLGERWELTLIVDLGRSILLPLVAKTLASMSTSNATAQAATLNRRPITTFGTNR